MSPEAGICERVISEQQTQTWPATVRSSHWGEDSLLFFFRITFIEVLPHKAIIEHMFSLIAPKNVGPFFLLVLILYLYFFFFFFFFYIGLH